MCYFYPKYLCPVRVFEADVNFIVARSRMRIAWASVLPPNPMKYAFVLFAFWNENRFLKAGLPLHMCFLHCIKVNSSKIHLNLHKLDVATLLYKSNAIHCNKKQQEAKWENNETRLLHSLPMYSNNNSIIASWNEAEPTAEVGFFGMLTHH